MKSIDNEPIGTYSTAPLITAPMPFTIEEATTTKRPEYAKWLRSEIIREHPKWAREQGLTGK